MESSTKQKQKEDEQLYTQGEVLNLIFKVKATTTDYLVCTYLNIFKNNNISIPNELTIRYNNIVFNNFDEIAKQLTLSVFLKRVQEILKQNLLNITYVSCIVPQNLKSRTYPICLQYFNPRNGIQQWILGYIGKITELSTFLAQQEILHKIVGYCGDFFHNDPFTYTFKSDHFSSLRILSRQNLLYHLPYEYNFIQKLFEVLSDYLDLDVVVTLEKFGEFILNVKYKPLWLQQIINQYKCWIADKNSVPILISDYTKSVSENFYSISVYLNPFQFLPGSIKRLFSSNFHRFLVVFLREIYFLINDMNFTNYSAISYYFYLVEIRNTFALYAKINYIPPESLNIFNDGNIPFQEIHKITSLSYKKCVDFIEAHLQLFTDFELFSWITLKNFEIDCSRIDLLFHRIHQNACSQACTIASEIENIKEAIKIARLESRDKIDIKWVKILNCSKPAPLITKLLEFLLCLPASCCIFSTCNDNFDDSYFQAKMFIKNNLKINLEEIIPNIEEFVGDYIHEAKNIIKNNEISVFVD